MDVMQYVKRVMTEEEITQSQLASKTEWSRQRVFAILQNNNSNYNSAKKILNALGRDLKISRKDGKEIDFDVDKLYSTIEKTAPLFGKLEKILNTMGYEIEIIKL